MRIGIVGYGHAGRAYARVLDELGETIAGVSDSSEVRLRDLSARQPQLATTRDDAALVSSADVDAVVVATPIETRLRIALAALEQGKHVLVDGPLGPGADGVQGLAELAAKLGLTLFLGHPQIHGVGVQRMKELLFSTPAGEIRSLRSQRCRTAAARRAADMLWEVAAHDISLFSFLLDREPEWIRASAEHSGVTGQVDRLDLLLGFPSGPAAQIAIAPLDAEHLSCVTAKTARLTVSLEDADPAKNVLWTAPVAADAPEPANGLFAVAGEDHAVREVVFEDPLREACAHFRACVAGEAQPRVGAASAAAIARVLDTALRSLTEATAPGAAAGRAAANEKASQ